MAFFIVNEEFYFAKKLESLQNDEAYKAEWTGKTVVDLKAFFEANGLTAQQHFDEFGWAEQLSANAEFDVAAYFAAKAKQTGLTVEEVIQAFKDNGLTVATHYEKYGKAEIEAGELDFTPGATAPSTLTEALANLQEAKLAKAEFLKEAAEIDFVKVATGATTEAKIAAAVTTADVALGTVSYEDSAGSSQTINVYTAGAVSAGGDSDGVKAAKIADAKAALAEDLKEAQEALDDAKADVAKVAGLKSAIDLFNARVDAQEVTAAALLAAEAAEAGAVASYNKVNSTATITPDATTGVVANVIVANATTGRLELATGVTETTNPGIGAVLAAVQARLNAAEADESAKDAIEAAVIAIGYIDVATNDKNAIGAEFSTPVAPGAASDKLTQSDVQVELNALLAKAEELGELTLNDTTGLITEIDGTPIGTETEVVAFNDLKTAVNAFEAALIAGAPAYTFTTADKTAAQVSKQNDVADVELAIAALAEAEADLAAAKAVAADLASYDDAIEAAEQVFTDLEFETPVAVAGTVVGTAENDLFLVSETTGTIVNFNAQGSDSIFVGDKFADLKVLTSTEVITGRVGDASVFEIFAKQNGSNVDLWVEQQSFAGNATGEVDLVKISLAGINVNDLVLSDGFLTIAA